MKMCASENYKTVKTKFAMCRQKEKARNESIEAFAVKKELFEGDEVNIVCVFSISKS